MGLQMHCHCEPRRTTCSEMSVYEDSNWMTDNCKEFIWTRVWWWTKESGCPKKLLPKNMFILPNIHITRVTLNVTIQLTDTGWNLLISNLQVKITLCSNEIRGCLDELSRSCSYSYEQEGNWGIHVWFDNIYLGTILRRGKRLGRGGRSTRSIRRGDDGKWTIQSQNPIQSNPI